MFDALSRSCFERYWIDETYFMEADTGDVVMECDWNPKRGVGTVRMTVFKSAGRGKYTKGLVELKEYSLRTRLSSKALRAGGVQQGALQGVEPLVGSGERGGDGPHPLDGHQVVRL